MTLILDATQNTGSSYMMEGRRISLILINGNGVSLDFEDPEGNWHSVMTFEGAFLGALPFTVPGINIRLSSPGGAKAWVVTS